MSRFGYFVCHAQDVMERNDLLVYPQFRCDVQCRFCPLMNEMIERKNVLGVNIAHIEWFIQNIKDLDRIVIKERDLHEHVEYDDFKRIKCAKSDSTQQMFIETCGLGCAVEAITDNCVNMIRLRLLGTVGWYVSCGHPMDRIHKLCSNIKTLQRWHTHNDQQYELVTYLHPEITIADLLEMKETFSINDQHSAWILEPYAGLDDSGIPFTYGIENITEVIEKTGARVRTNQFEPYCKYTTTITIKERNEPCVTVNETQQPSNSTATTEPCPSSNEEATSQEASTSDAANIPS